MVKEDADLDEGDSSGGRGNFSSTSGAIPLRGSDRESSLESGIERRNMDDVNVVLLVLIRRNVEGPAGRTNGCGTERKFVCSTISRNCSSFYPLGKGMGREGEVRYLVRFRGKKTTNS